MFNRKSIYALNKKDPDAIVYMDANEVIVRLTREDFASEKEFLKWKALSDEDYHASEKEAHVYANHTLALDELYRYFDPQWTDACPFYSAHVTAPATDFNGGDVNVAKNAGRIARCTQRPIFQLRH